MATEIFFFLLKVHCRNADKPESIILSPLILRKSTSCGIDSVTLAVKRDITLSTELIVGSHSKMGSKLKKEEEDGDPQWGIPRKGSHGIEGRRKDDIKNNNFHDNLGCSDGKNNEITRHQTFLFETETGIHPF